MFYVQLSSKQQSISQGHGAYKNNVSASSISNTALAPITYTVHMKLELAFYYNNRLDKFIMHSNQQLLP